MVDVRAQIDKAVASAESDVIAWRHEIHRHPELSGLEVATATLVANHLDAVGLEVRRGVGGHGVVGILRGAGSGPTIALRADMDALPVQELQDVPYKSEVDGVSHMCGHDVHTAALMGAASALAAVRDALPGTVVFLFQPAEEGPPLGVNAGAAAMVADGVLDDPTPGMTFVLHTAPLPNGTVALMRGNALASSDYVSITVEGAGVHGSTPWMGRDPMPVAAEIITALGQLYRQIPATDAITVSIGSIKDEGRFNVIGDRVELIGTVRLLNPALIEDVHARIARIATNVAEAHGLVATTRFEQHVPALVNAPEWIDRVSPTIERLVGREAMFDFPGAMGYDDASEFVNRTGGAYLMFGGQDVRIEAEGPVPTEGGRGFWYNHSPRFYFNDNAIIHGVRMYAHVAYDFLSGNL